MTGGAFPGLPIHGMRRGRCHVDASLALSTAPFHTFGGSPYLIVDQNFAVGRHDSGYLLAVDAKHRVFPPQIGTVFVGLAIGHARCDRRFNPAHGFGGMAVFKVDCPCSNPIRGLLITGEIDIHMTAVTLRCP